MMQIESVDSIILEHKTDSDRGILFLTNNENTKELYNWLLQKECNVYLCNEKITLDYIEKLQPKLIISYNYKFIINSDIIQRMKHKIINLHISLLPWNRGADPNIWSFIENTPKGITIHYIDENIDTGDILFQEELKFDEKAETLRSTYNNLNNKIQTLFKENWREIKEGKVIGRKQEGQGSYHTRSDLNKIIFINTINFDESICDFKKRIKDYRG